MTDEKKQQLTALLQAALAHLEIRQDSAGRHESISVNEYRSILQRFWTYSSMDVLLTVMRYEPHIANASIKSKLLDLIREAFSEFILEDQIQSASFFIHGGPIDGYPLDNLLKQLLRIAIMLGVEKATSDFDRCTKNPSGSFQYIALLQGIEVEKEIQVFEGPRIVPLSNSISELPHYLPSDLYLGPLDFLTKTLLVIDASISPIFCEPQPQGIDSNVRPGFEVEVTGKNFLNGNVDNFEIMTESYVNYFYDKFCLALSLICNSAVQVAAKWKFLAKHELFNLTPSMGGGVSRYLSVDLLGSSTVAGETQIGEAKRLYRKMITLEADTAEKLQIPIERWIKSKANKDLIDEIIDLGIALEALYLSEGTREQLTLQFRLRASWYLGNDKEHRKRLMDEFKAIYDLRSQAVHSGKIPKKVKIRKGEEPTPTSEFIAKAQNLCRDSILKILEDGKFPKKDDWNDLILGEESL